MLEMIHNKRAVLVAQRDQSMANLNATIGAIAVCDELIVEALAAQSKAKDHEAELDAAAERLQNLEAAVMVEPAATINTMGDVIGNSGPVIQGDKPVEMPAVSRFYPCDDCIAPDCESEGRCCCAL